MKPNKTLRLLPRNDRAAANATRKARLMNQHAQCWLVAAQVSDTKEQLIAKDLRDTNKMIQTTTIYNDVITMSPVEYLAALLKRHDTALLMMAIPITNQEAELARIVVQRQDGEPIQAAESNTTNTTPPERNEQ